VKAEEDETNSAQFSFCLIADIVKSRTANSCPAFLLFSLFAAVEAIGFSRWISPEDAGTNYGDSISATSQIQTISISSNLSEHEH
jgi:hypothetical protein